MMYKIAIPIKDHKLSAHYEDRTFFLIVSIHRGTVVQEDLLPAPQHQNDSTPKWLVEQGVSDVITADIGLEAVKILSRHKINVFAGVKKMDAKILVQEYLDGILETRGNF